VININLLKLIICKIGPNIINTRSKYLILHLFFIKLFLWTITLSTDILITQTFQQNDPLNNLQLIRG